MSGREALLIIFWKAKSKQHRLSRIIYGHVVPNLKKMKLQFKILFLLLIVNSICIGQNTISSDSIFQEIINNPKTEFSKKTYSGGIIKEFYDLNNQRNNWTAFNEFHPNGRIKEKGIFLNGYNYGIWTEYDSKEEIISQIDYSIPKQIVGQNQIHINEFQEALESLACRDQSRR